ncbi:MAG: GDP-mannose mannosyl hydrolase [Chitinophagales bacterium]|nr:GDP-mannose mannosyl hydrolase [Chitinophagales bacterium]
MLPLNDFEQLIRNGVLIAIDLICYNPEGKVLLGLRKNAPAKGFWFVPGGRVHKNETLNNAFQRITQHELHMSLDLSKTKLKGLYDHIYEENFLGKPDFNTHYVIIAVEYHGIDNSLLSAKNAQNEDFKFLKPEEILVDPMVHTLSKSYFQAQPNNHFDIVY